MPLILNSHIINSPGSFHGSLRNTQQRRSSELPQPLDLKTFVCRTTKPAASTTAAEPSAISRTALPSSGKWGV